MGPGATDPSGQSWLEAQSAETPRVPVETMRMRLPSAVEGILIALFTDDLAASIDGVSTSAPCVSTVLHSEGA